MVDLPKPLYLIEVLAQTIIPPRGIRQENPLSPSNLYLGK